MMRKPRPEMLRPSSDESDKSSVSCAAAAEGSAKGNITGYNVAEGVVTHQPSGITINKDGTFGLDIDNVGLAGEYLICKSDFKYDKYKPIGAGRSSWVYKAEHLKSGMTFAIKEIDLGFFGVKKRATCEVTRNNRNQLFSEIGVWKLASSCPMLVQFFGAYITNNSRGGRSVHLVLEYMRYGSLDNLRRRLLRVGLQRVPEEFLKLIAFQVLDGLMCLHNSKHMHRDVKPHNILINEKGFVKLSDFGICRSVEDESRPYTFIGTKIYMSPERLKLSSAYTYSFPADIWSFGIVLFELATGRHPFSNGDFLEAELPDVRLPEELSYTEEFKDFINLCLQKDPAKRYTAQQLLNHRWLQYGMAPIHKFQCWLREIYSMKPGLSSESESECLEINHTDQQLNDFAPPWLHTPTINLHHEGTRGGSSVAVSTLPSQTPSQSSRCPSPLLGSHPPPSPPHGYKTYVLPQQRQQGGMTTFPTGAITRCTECGVMSSAVSFNSANCNTASHGIRNTVEGDRCEQPSKAANHDPWKDGATHQSSSHFPLRDYSSYPP